MKSLEQIYILNYLSDEVWRAVTGLLDVVERFERADKADKETVRKFYYEDAVNSLEMWRTLIGNHTKTWEDSLNEIDLTEVNVELLDDCPDNNTLQNRLRIVKNRYCGTWKITKVGESDIIFDRLLHIVDRLTEILYSVYDWSKEDAHNKAIKWHDYLLQKWCNVLELQNYMQSVIDNAESILNPQPDTTTEQELIIKRSPITNENGINKAFSLAEEKGLMLWEDNYYRWLKDNALLSYFCERLYNVFLNTTKGNKSWGHFSNWFIVKGINGKDIIPDGVKLNRYKTDWKQDRLLDREDPFCPDGYSIVDDIIIKAKS